MADIFWNNLFWYIIAIHGETNHISYVSHDLKTYIEAITATMGMWARVAAWV